MDTVHADKIIITDNINPNGDFILIKKNMSPFFAVSFDRLYGVVCDISDRSPYNSGIPQEVVAIIDMSANGPSVKYEENDKIAYFSPDGYGTKEDVMNVVLLFNQLSSIKLTIYVTHDISSIIRGFVNENITLIDYKDAKDLSITASKFITHGYYTRHFIKKRVPTIVVGTHGMGGWVTPDNMEYLLKDNFKGRPGGYLNEPVPLEILVDEFMEIKECKNLQDILDKNALLLKNHMDRLTIKPPGGRIKHFKSLYYQLKDISKREGLKPRMASNIRTVESGDNVLVRRNVLNDILFSLDKGELELIDDLKGKMTCGQLREKYEMSCNEFWDIIVALWERKAIVF